MAETLQAPPLQKDFPKSGYHCAPPRKPPNPLLSVNSPLHEWTIFCNMHGHTALLGIAPSDQRLRSLKGSPKAKLSSPAQHAKPMQMVVPAVLTTHIPGEGPTSENPCMRHFFCPHYPHANSHGCGPLYSYVNLYTPKYFLHAH